MHSCHRILIFDLDKLSHEIPIGGKGRCFGSPYWNPHPSTHLATAKIAWLFLKLCLFEHDASVTAAVASLGNPVCHPNQGTQQTTSA